MTSVLHNLMNSVSGHHDSAVHDSKTANKLDPRVNSERAEQAARDNVQNAGKGVEKDVTGTADQGKRTTKDEIKDWKPGDQAKHGDKNVKQRGQDVKQDVKQDAQGAKDKVTRPTKGSATSKPGKEIDSDLGGGDKKAAGTTARNTGGTAGRINESTTGGTSGLSHNITGKTETGTKHKGSATGLPKNDIDSFLNGDEDEPPSSSHTGYKSDTIDSDKSLRGYRGGTSEYDSGTTGITGTTSRNSSVGSDTGPAGTVGVPANTGGYGSTSAGHRGFQVAGYGEDEYRSGGGYGSTGADRHGSQTGAHSGTTSGIVGKYHIAADDATVAHHKVDEDMLVNDNDYDQRSNNRSNSYGQQLDDVGTSRGTGFYNIPPDDLSNVSKTSNTTNLRSDLDQGRNVRELHSQF